MQQAIETKFEIIQSLQSTWLNRTLGKNRSNIKIDKLIDIDEISGCKELLLDLQRVKEKAEKTFTRQFQKLNVKLNVLNEFWQEIYRPKGQFTQQMLLVIEPITLQEWDIMVMSLSNKSALGPSGISYRILKKLPEEFNSLIVALINCCFSLSIVLTQWKASHIIPIPKPQKFAYDITNTRLIALLDTFQKVSTKIMTQRLSYLLTE